MKLAKKLSLLIASASIVLLLCLWLIASLITGSIEEEFGRQLENEAKIVMRLIDANLFERYHDVSAFSLFLQDKSKQKFLAQVQSQVTQNYFNKMIQHYGVYRRILVLNERGEVLQQNNQTTAGGQLPLLTVGNDFIISSAWFQDIVNQRYLNMNDDNFVSVYGPARNVLGEEKNANHSFDMVFATPIFDEGNQINGFLVNVMDFSVVENLIAESYKVMASKKLTTAEFTLLDPAGNILVDYDPVGQQKAKYTRDFNVTGQLNLAENGVEAARLAIAGLSGSGKFLHFRKQILQLSGFAHSQGVYDFIGLNWSMLLRVADSEINDKTADIRNIVYGVGFFLILSAFALKVWITQRISLPLERSTSALNKLSHGELDIDVPISDSRDEINSINTSIHLFKKSLIEKQKLEQKSEEQRLQLEIRNRAIDVTATGIVVSDAQQPETPLVYVNKAFERLTGYSADETIGKNCRFLQGDDTDPAELAKLRFAIASGEACNVLLANYRKDGSKFINNLRIDPVFDDDGRLTHFIGVQSDVTEYRREQEFQKLQLEKTIEERTRKSINAEERLRTIFNTSLDGTVVFDEAGRIIDVNRSAELIFGRIREELIDTQVESLLGDSSKNQYQDWLQELKSQHNIERQEVTLLHKSSREFPAEIAIGIGIGEGSQGHIFVAVMRDISEQKAQLELQWYLQQGQKLASVAGGICSWDWDLASNKIQWDEGMYELYGFTQNQSVTYDDWYSCLEKTQAQDVAYRLSQSVDKKQPWIDEFQIITHDTGEIKWIKVSTDMLLDNNGNIDHMFGVNIDVTKEKKVQDQLEKESILAKQASEAKSRFLATMSHEIRTPMNGIIGMTDLLCNTEMTAEQQRMTKTIRESSFSLLTVINDILDFSKIEAGQVELELVNTDLNSLLKQATETLWGHAIENNVEIYLLPDLNMPKQVILDPVRIRQAVLNLLGNAIKFSKRENRKGIVHITSRLMCSDEQEMTIEISIKDNGLGMTQEQQAKLFKPFTQADSSTTRHYGGTGLGLSITKSFVDMMKGEIEVHSEPDNGSEFIIRVPIVHPDDITPAFLPSELSGVSILCHHSDEHIIAVIEHTLSYFDCQLTMLTELAVGQSEQDFDVVILEQDLSTAPSKGEQNKMPKYLLINKEQGLATGFVSDNCYRISAHPLTAKDIVIACAILTDRMSPRLNELIEVQETAARQQLIVPTIAEARKSNTLILVAEDQPTNQDVIRRQLHKLGYACEIVDNGQQALEKLQQGGIGLLLTDCHMPVVDGYELSRTIRHHEQSSGRNRLPIVAITANAISGESGVCKQAGMDDYLAKPIILANLKVMIEKWLPSSAVKPECDDKSTYKQNELVNSAAVVNYQLLADILGSDDLELANEIILSGWQTIKNDYSKLLQTLDSKQFEDIKKTAHALKGVAQFSGAEPLSQTLGDIEAAVKKNNINELKQLKKRLTVNFEQLEQFITKLNQTHVNKKIT